MNRRSFLLFTGTNDRAVVALTRAFDECRADYSLIARNDRDRILSSRYRQRVAAVRDSEDMTMEIFEDLLASVRRRRPDDRFVVVPNSEFLNCFFLDQDRDELLAKYDCELPLVDRALYHRLSDKLAACEVFAAAGIRVPRQIESAARASLPLVAKPVRNVDPAGTVRYPLLLRSGADLEEFLGRPDRSEYFLQEFVAGISEYLLAYFAGNGDVFASSQTNLAQQPGGKSIVLAATSRFHTQPVAETAVRMLRDQGFRGFAMLEFIDDGAGPCFIEMNPRPWGPLQLCRDHRCGLVEAFVGDAMEGDPHRHRAVWERRPRDARYAWIGGMLETRRHGGRLAWSRAVGSRAGCVAKSLSGDVYFRADTWRIFARELVGR